MARKTLAIVGAGAKAAAIVARAAILREFGVKDVPEILVYEENHIGASWSGRGRFSSGFLTLCTPGEKDVGFPYIDVVARGGASAPIAASLFGRFSWGAFLVSTGRMSEWVDRGRNHPSHRSWAEYLEWVFRTAKHNIVKASVVAIRPAGHRWEISSVEKRRKSTTVVDGIVLTGAGRSKTIPSSGDVPAGRIFDAETFWAGRESILALKEGTITVAGDGGAAGAIVAWLAEHFAERPVAIVSVNPMGTLFPRGDGHAERRWFSDPSDWAELTVDHRQELIQRTEAGVVSMRNKQIIDQSPNIGYRRGRVVEANGDGNEIMLKINYNSLPIPDQPTDYLITAIGFDIWSLLDLVHDDGVPLLRPGNALQRKQVEADILPDLTLPPISELPSGLHVPALAALTHGPGMDNLGCLGLMAAAVLRRYHAA